MQGLKKLLLKEQKKLEMICSKVENELKSVPKGNLRISKDKNKNIFLYRQTLFV